MKAVLQEGVFTVSPAQPIIVGISSRNGDLGRRSFHLAFPIHSNKRSGWALLRNGKAGTSPDLYGYKPGETET